MSAPAGPSAASEEFIYDHLGNRYQLFDKDGYITTYTHNPVNQYGMISKDYGFFGLKDDRYPLHDDNGNLAEDGQGYIYTYDYRNRLIKVELDTETIAEYVYDALGRRIAKTVGNTTTYFYYDTDNRVIAQYTQEQNEDVQPDRTFVYGNGIGEILAMYLYEKPYSQDDVDLLFGFFDCWLTSSGNGSYNDSYDYVNDNKIDLKDWAVLANHAWNLPDLPSYETRFYYLTDALGSVRGLIGGRLNREEDREFYNYDVYGDSSDSSAAGNPFRFAGYRNDPESGLYYLVNRMYDAYTGRLLQFDPLGINPVGGENNPFNVIKQYSDSMNLYEYVRSNPVLFVDPHGLIGPSPLRCCNGIQYNVFDQCCEDGKVASKVPIWECRRTLLKPRNFWLPLIGSLSHTFIACENPATTPWPNVPAFGKQPRKTVSPPHSHRVPIDPTDPLPPSFSEEPRPNPFVGPGFIEEEPQWENDGGRDFSHCQMRKVCPSEKRRMCKEGPTANPYFLPNPIPCGFPFGSNCHNWGGGCTQ